MPIIRSKFIPPTNTRGSRVKAETFSYVAGRKVSVTLAWDYALNPTQNHHRAAEALAKQYGWEGAWRYIEDANGAHTYVRDIEMHDVFTVEA